MGYSERRKELGNAIRRERERQKLSQRKLASMIGASSHSYIVEIEKGATSIGFDMLCSIADALNVRVSSFFKAI